MLSATPRHRTCELAQSLPGRPSARVPLSGRLSSPQSQRGPPCTIVWLLHRLQRQITTRTAHRKLLQQRLDGFQSSRISIRNLRRTGAVSPASALPTLPWWCSLLAPMPKSTASKRRRSPPISAVEKTAVRIMRKLYEATGGQPQRWECLGNLGAIKADAAGSG